jgi:hypothetical protein
MLWANNSDSTMVVHTDTSTDGVAVISKTSILIDKMLEGYNAPICLIISANKVIPVKHRHTIC